jgi:hypothetical protein
LTPEKLNAVQDEFEIRVLFEDAFGSRGLTSVKLSGAPSSAYPTYYPDEAVEQGSS